MDKKTALENIAKKGKTTVAILQKELDEVIAQMPDSPDRERLALRELNNRYSGPEDSSNKFDFVVVGYSNLTDFNRKTLNDVMADYKRDPEGTLESGRVKLDAMNHAYVVDLKESFGDNFKNANFGKELGHSWSRNAIVLAKEVDGSNYVLADLALRGGFANTDTPEMFKVFTGNFLGTLDKGLKTAKTTKFGVSEQQIDVASVLEEVAKDKLLMLGDCFAEAKKHTKGEAGYYSRFVITSGDCRFMNEPKHEGGNYSGTFDDFTTDNQIQVFVDPLAGKPVIGDEYTLIAQTSVKPSYVKETKSNTGPDALVMNIMGFYKS